MEDSKWRKWRPRFSLRTLLVLPLLVGLFLTLGHLTNNYGRDHVQTWLEENGIGNGGRVKHEGPLIVSQGYITAGINNTAETNKTFYLWLFGSVRKLPWETKYIDQIDENNSFNDIAERRLR